MAKLTEKKLKAVTRSWNVMSKTLGDYDEVQLGQLYDYEMTHSKRCHMGRRILVCLKKLESKNALIRFDKKYGKKK